MRTGALRKITDLPLLNFFIKNNTTIFINSKKCDIPEDFINMFISFEKI